MVSKCRRRPPDLPGRAGRPPCEKARGAARSNGSAAGGSVPPKGFYENIKPRLHRRIGRALRLAGRVVDIGCGACELVAYLARTYRQTVIGIDVSGQAFPRARRTRAGVRFRCVAGDAARMGFISDQSIDAVVTMWALHELDRPHAVLAEAYRILRPGGKVLVVDFPRGSLAQELWGEKYYNLRQVEQMLARTKFVDVRGRLIERGQIMWISARRPVIRP